MQLTRPNRGALLSILLAMVLAACGPGGAEENNANNSANAAPIIGAFAATGDGTLEVSFEWTASDSNGDTLTCTLDVDGDGAADYTIQDCAANSQQHAFTEAGTYMATLTVTDGKGGTVSATTTVVVGSCPAPEVISGSSVSTETTLTNRIEPMDCVDYVVTASNYNITSHLTLEPGVVIAFEGGAMTVNEDATLTAEGTASLPIILTTAGPMAGRAPGSWNGLVVKGGTASLDRVTIEYAGGSDMTSSNYDAPANLTLRDGAILAMQNSVIRDGAGYGIFSDFRSDISPFEENTVTTNAFGAVQTDATAAHAFGASSRYTGNGVDAIFVDPRNGNIEGDVTWQAIDVPFVITQELSDLPLFVGAGHALMLAPGVVLEFEENVALLIDGSLNAPGTDSAPITLTARSPATQKWGGLVVKDEGSGELAYAIIEHGGSVDLTSSNYDAPANIVIRNGGSLNLVHSIIRESAGYGIFVDQHSTVPEFLMNTVTANALSPVLTDAPVAFSFGATNSYTGNDVDRVFVNRFGNVTGDVTWDAIDVPFHIKSDLNVMTLFVDTGNSLTLAPGVTLEFERGVAFQIEGILVSEGTEDARITIRDVTADIEAVSGNFGGILVYDGRATFAYTSILNGGGTDLGFDDLRANVVISSFTRDDDATSSVSFGAGMEQSGAPYGVAFDIWAGSDETTSASGCDAMTPIRWPYPEDTANQC